MATSTVLKFMQQTGADESLRQKLETLLGVGDGDISSSETLDAEESAALSERAPRVIEFAAEQGYQFSEAELLTVIDAFQQYQQGRISDSDFAKIAGMETGRTLKPQTKSSFQRMASYLTKTYLGIDLN